MRKTFLNTVQKIRLKIFYRYGELVKNEMVSLSNDINYHIYSKVKSIQTRMDLPISKLFGF